MVPKGKNIEDVLILLDDLSINEYQLKEIIKNNQEDEIIKKAILHKRWNEHLTYYLLKNIKCSNEVIEFIMDNIEFDEELYACLIEMLFSFSDISNSDFKTKKLIDLINKLYKDCRKNEKTIDLFYFKNDVSLDERIETLLTEEELSIEELNSIVELFISDCFSDNLYFMLINQKNFNKEMFDRLIKEYDLKKAIERALPDNKNYEEHIKNIKTIADYSDDAIDFLLEIYYLIQHDYNIIKEYRKKGNILDLRKIEKEVEDYLVLKASVDETSKDYLFNKIVTILKQNKRILYLNNLVKKIILDENLSEEKLYILASLNIFECCSLICLHKNASFRIYELIFLNQKVSYSSAYKQIYPMYFSTDELKELISRKNLPPKVLMLIVLNIDSDQSEIFNLILKNEGADDAVKKFLLIKSSRFNKTLYLSLYNSIKMETEKKPISESLEENSDESFAMLDIIPKDLLPSCLLTYSKMMELINNIDKLIEANGLNDLLIEEYNIILQLLDEHKSMIPPEKIEIIYEMLLFSTKVTKKLSYDDKPITPDYESVCSQNKIYYNHLN